MKLGFVGTGALSSAIVTGLKSLPGETTPVVISPRNEEIAAELAARYPDVRIAADNQAVLDQCDTVMLAVRPQIAHEVLRELRFRKDHHVVSLIATISREEIAGLVALAAQVGKALPMLMIARLQGATIICPPDPIVAVFFGRLGGVIEVEDQNEFDALSVVTATYASYFRYLDTIDDWVRGQGVADEKSRAYITSIYKALANAPDTAPDEDFMHLSQNYATRGGINEQMLRELTERGTFEAVTDSLRRVHRRITGQ
ncbi:pyrroline-5-carboxylate reductase [Mesorhizobium sp. VK25A]|uniref:Pyrroline-5-carboxylate reductase n=1 Tax=Mesorhizobium vachelliae TaxID=3072309 RepID=A0ABU5A0W1_9HYPH|nr:MULTISPECIES: pyrroline-5-carboxylate reductase [unclassified Mesorhizobium]MDX8531318.1 pyrroline-5-carboxylate reductase [Mesorhizobium sp. VK25D]MDX8542931.1 pyrroline-5-carboxylate reductase [Mesorhizobium sp. VK25A]